MLESAELGGLGGAAAGGVVCGETDDAGGADGGAGHAEQHGGRVGG